MSRPGTAHARFERNLQRLLSAPHEEIILFRPRDGEERVVTDLADPVAAGQRCMALVADGFVKVTFVQSATARARLDIRHGGIEAQVRESGGEWRRIDRDADAPRGPAGTVANQAPHRQAPAPQTRSGVEARGPTTLSSNLLRVIGIANADGSISAQNAKKLKQTRHLVELFRPALAAVASRRSVSEGAPLRILDLASGNAYLSFVLADTLNGARVPARIHGIERRPELVTHCVERARTLGLDGLTFAQGSISDAENPFVDAPDLVAALHACDTATDEAIATGIRLGAAAIFVAPCCQAEIAAQLRAFKGGPTPGIAHHGLLTREYAAVLTDAIRVEVLDACGYDVDVVEFTDPEHTPKNRLLRATLRRDTTARAGRSLGDVQARCEGMGLRPSLLALLGRGDLVQLGHLVENP